MTRNEMLGGEPSMYTKVQNAIMEAIKEGEDHIYVGREFYKDEHVLWLDNKTMTRLEEDGFHIGPFHNHEWEITW